MLPKTQWIKNYKKVEGMDDWLAEGEQEADDGEEVVQTPLMQQINQTRSKVTGKVVGVIKKLPKTYGGSLLNLDQMLPAT